MSSLTILAPRRRLLLMGILVVLALGAAACSSGDDTASPAAVASTPTSTPTSTATSAAPTPLRSESGDALSGTAVTKLLVFVVENHSLGQMTDEMPFLRGLARRYGYATNYRALTHPSLPNYLAMAGGDTFGIHDDDPPSTHAASGSSVFGRALAVGSSATLYAEGMDEPCRGEDGAGGYVVRHNPWTYFPAEAAQCAQHDVPLDRLAGDVEAGRLPAVGMAIPDVCNDAHDCGLDQADGWLRDQLATVLAGPDWASGHLAVVVTADEDDEHHGNRVLTVVAHPALDHRVVDAPLTHYSLSRAYAEVGHFAPLRHARQATSLLDAFGLTAG